MSQRATAFIIAALFLGAASAHAGPCTYEIQQFEQQIRQSANNPDAGPFGQQTIGAQTDRQPTPASVKRARQRARAGFNAAFARAKRLDARGSSGCTQALADARRMYNLH